MSNEIKKTRELVRAFNACLNGIAVTNFTVSLPDESIVGLLDGSTDLNQAMKHFGNLGESIISEFCNGDNETAERSFKLNYFPFKFSYSQFKMDSEGRLKFLVPIDDNVIFNLQCYLAHVSAQDAKVKAVETMMDEYGVDAKAHMYEGFVDRKNFLYHIYFNNKKVQNCFINSFLSEIKNYVDNPKKEDFLLINGNSVCIKKHIFDDRKFIIDMEKYNVRLIADDFLTPTEDYEDVENIKYPIVEFMKAADVSALQMVCIPKKNSTEDSLIVPITTSQWGDHLLTKEQKDIINRAFGHDVLKDVSNIISKGLAVYSSNGTYAIDFKDPEISYCIIDKIIETSVIDRNGRLAIDPDLLQLHKERKVEEVVDSNTKTPPSERRHLTADVKRSLSISPRKDSDGIFPRNHSDVSLGTSWGNQANHLTVNNGNVMSTSAHSQNSQNSVDSGIGSITNISQSDDLKPTLQSMKYVAHNVVPLPQQSTNIAHQLPHKSDTILDDPKPVPQPVEGRSGGQGVPISSLVKTPLPNNQNNITSNNVKSGHVLPPLVEASWEHTSSTSSLGENPLWEVPLTNTEDTTSKPANKTSKEKSKDLSSSTRVRSSLRNLNVFKHAKDVNTYKSDQREKSSCIIL